tara:strand:+ start:7446 stop:7763 length:318 start_codon:yes stop_codon:yes gene_type:complete
MSRDELIQNHFLKVLLKMDEMNALTNRQAAILVAAKIKPGINLEEISKKLNSTVALTDSMVRSLTKKGLVELDKHKGLLWDRKVSLTKTGEEAVAPVVPKERSAA